ncbi:MAG: 50S ribosomal protein L18 [Eubacteriales bacterium]|nr:50S ribosomal protein L18 [Eubacteriales bacterium]
MNKMTDKNKIRSRIHARIRKKVKGTSERPRLNVFRSLKHIYAQIIDDTAGITVASASTLDEEYKSKKSYGGNKAAAAEIGAMIAKRATEKGIKAVVFDRGGYIYHGRIKELAEAARKEGLEF